MGKFKNSGEIALCLLTLLLASCAGKSQLVGSDGSRGAATSDSSVSYTFSPLNLGAGECLPAPIQNDTNCKVFTTRSGDACGCSEPGLTKTTAGVTEATRRQLQLVGHCGNAGQPSCDEYCACEVSRATSTSLIECKTLPASSPGSTGWCYVSAEAGEPQTDLVADCPSEQPQRLRFMGDSSAITSAPTFLACVDGQTPLPRALGEVCSQEFESDPKFRLDGFRGYDVDEVNIIDRTTVCSSSICVINHFQGLVNCPYGQAAGDGDCRPPGSDEVLAFKVKPQFEERQAAVAAICSCQCDGPGPGPFCTCPESMQCEHLIDDLGLPLPAGQPNLAGSYCIPKGTAYDRDAPRTECVEPHCGAKHPY